mmetsp:Transcript_26159/g.38969  ORF Transcript_26159/g.38969 Transcript_26159/m.38969 type:complete len:84 (-) Transcript_26159:785-1036(-)
MNAIEYGYCNNDLIDVLEKKDYVGLYRQLFVASVFSKISSLSAFSNPSSFLAHLFIKACGYARVKIARLFCPRSALRTYGEHT